MALGPDGTPGPVEGELAAYVTSQGVVTDNGYRFYRVVVDLRAQNEIATDGSIAARAVGGGVRVETKTADGADDTRDVSLILLVENTRLRTFDPESRAIASDVTSEAVHFTGDAEHWIVTNNIALPNAIPCASGEVPDAPAQFRLDLHPGPGRRLGSWLVPRRARGPANGPHGLHVVGRRETCARRPDDHVAGREPAPFALRERDELGADLREP